MSTASETTQTLAPSQLRLIPLLICLAIGTFIWMLPKPESIAENGWHLLALFIAVISGIILKPLPMGAVAFIGLTLVAITNTLTLSEVLGSFSNPVVWLVLSAFFIAKGFLSSGLAMRMAYHLVGLLGKRTIGLGYGLILADLSLAPAIPSDTARAGGIVFPILKGLSETYESHPKNPTSRRMGSFLTLCAFQGSVVTSSMFLTAMATNPLIAELAEGLGFDLSWGKWALAALVPGLLSLSLIPLLLYWLYPPSIKATPDATRLAREKLWQMGRISSKEWITVCTFVLLLVLWIGGPYLGIKATVAAMAGISLLLITGVLEWKELVTEKRAWETLIWFSALIMMATHLQTTGVTDWFGSLITGHIGGASWKVAFPVLALLYFFSHYLFAGNTSHVSAFFVPFVVIAIGIGTPPSLAILVLAFFSCLFSGITHYGTASAPLLYGGGYVDVRSWWKLGFICALLNIAIWGGLGVLWWKVLGLW